MGATPPARISGTSPSLPASIWVFPSSVCTARILVWLLIASFVYAGSVSSAGQESQTRVIRNQDVVSLSKAGLSDAAIIAVIQKSKTEFDLSPGSLVALRDAGVSNTVIEAMVGVPPPARAAGVAPAAPSINGIPLPTEYGYYLVERDRLLRIEAVPIRVVIGLRPSMGGAGWAVDGVPGEPSFTVSEETPTFLIYQQTVDIQKALYGLAGFVSSMRAGEFDGAHVNPQFFSGIYGRNYNDMVPVNLWRPKGEANFIVEPIVGIPGMFKIRAQAPLPPGRYLAFFEGAIHLAGTIFATSDSGSFSALFFKVGSSAAACVNYNSCITSGREALRSSQWYDALDAFQKASSLDPAKPNAWAEMGHVFLALGRYKEIPTMWDKAIALGGPVDYSVCHERALFCERGTFTLGPQEISFATPNGKKLFAVAPADVASAGAFKMRLIPTAYLRLKAGNKNYNFDFIPFGVDCSQPGAVLECPPQGIEQQLAVANYISQAIPRLTSGALGGKQTSTKP